MLQGEGIARPGDQEEEARGQQDSYSQGVDTPFQCTTSSVPKGQRFTTRVPQQVSSAAVLMHKELPQDEEQHWFRDVYPDGCRNKGKKLYSIIFLVNFP